MQSTAGDEAVEVGVDIEMVRGRHFERLCWCSCLHARLYGRELYINSNFGAAERGKKRRLNRRLNEMFFLEMAERSKSDVLKCRLSSTQESSNARNANERMKGKTQLPTPSPYTPRKCTSKCTLDSRNQSKKTTRMRK